MAGCVALASPCAALDPLNHWVDGCQASDPDLQALLENDALIISANAVQDNGAGGYRLNTQAFTQLIQGSPTGNPSVDEYCPQARFYGQPQVIYQLANANDIVRRSAVQVGPDLVLTTWHNPFDPQHLKDYKVVFGLYARDVGGVCVLPDFEDISAAQVYELDAVVADGGGPGVLDLLLLRLDRVASEHYPRVRRSGRGWPADDITGIGHPQRLAAKVDLLGKAGGIERNNGRESLLVESLHMLPDSSGSMVYNRTQRILETAANVGGSLSFEFLPAQSCYVIHHKPGFSARNASLRYLAQHIPAFELLVESLDPVIHVVGPLGAGVLPTNARTVKAPLTADGPLGYQIVPPGPSAPGQPSLSVAVEGSLTGTLSPGAELGVQETASLNGASCGFYERNYEIRDLTNGFVDRARHVFEIGIREFTVSDPGRPFIEDLAHPFEDEIEYTITNPRPTPVVVRATASESWLRLGQAEPGAQTDPPATVDLLVQQGSPVVLKAGIAGWAQALPYSSAQEPHTASISFDVAPGDPCPTIGGGVTRQVKFVYGAETIEGPGGVSIPPQGSVLVEVDVDEDFCIDDVDLEVETSGVPSSDVVADLKSSSAQCRVWSEGVLSPPGPLRGTLDDEGALHPFELLSTFDDTNGGGIWRFTVANLGDGSGTEASLDSWALILKAKQCP
jgi:hypothetical protein